MICRNSLSVIELFICVCVTTVYVVFVANNYQYSLQTTDDRQTDRKRRVSIDKQILELAYLPFVLFSCFSEKVKI